MHLLKGEYNLCTLNNPEVKNARAFIRARASHVHEYEEF